MYAGTADVRLRAAKPPFKLFRIGAETIPPDRVGSRPESGARVRGGVESDLERALIVTRSPVPPKTLLQVVTFARENNGAALI